MQTLVAFAVLVPIYLAPVAVAWNAHMTGRAQCFIIGSLFVSMLAMFPPMLVFLDTPADRFTIAAAGSSIIFPAFLWFAAFAAACLAPVKPVSMPRLDVVRHD